MTDLQVNKNIVIHNVSNEMQIAVIIFRPIPDMINVQK